MKKRTDGQKNTRENQIFHASVFLSHYVHGKFWPGDEANHNNTQIYLLFGHLQPLAKAVQVAQESDSHHCIIIIYSC